VRYKKPLITKAELEKTRSSLPEGAYKTIADITGYAESSVKQILLRPERINVKNLVVIEQAIILSEQTNDKIDDFKDRIKYTI
jgi:hypothetical protein